MESSIYSGEELPARNCESIIDTRNGPYSSGNVAATELCHQRNCRHGFHANESMCNSSGGNFRDMLQNIQEMRNEASHLQASPLQRVPVHTTCSCNGQPSDLFCGHDHQNDHTTMTKRCCHRMNGSTSHFGNQAGHLHNFCDRGCCGPMRGGRLGGMNNSVVVDRTSPLTRSSFFLESLEFQRSATAIGCLPHCPSTTQRDVETRGTSLLHTGSTAKSTFSSEMKPSSNQIILYGWFLMKPLSENYNTDPSMTSGVAIGGYRCPRMADTDFFETAPVVQRLERWKLRMSDGMEVGLMGMINIEKSVANGFAPSLVQCFMIGFPSAWVYMLLNLHKGVSKSSSPSLSPPVASAADSPAVTGVVRDSAKDCLEPPKTLPLQANFVQTILHSPLFRAAPDSESRLATLNRVSTATTNPLRDGFASCADLDPHLHLGHEQVDAPKDVDNVSLQPDFVVHNPAGHPQEPLSDRDCFTFLSEGNGAAVSGQVPESSSQTPNPTKSRDCPSVSDDVKVDDGGAISPGRSTVAIENGIHSEFSSGRAEPVEESEVDAAECSPPDDFPCTPLLQSRTRLRSDVNLIAADASPSEPAADTDSPLQHHETRRLSCETTQPVVKKVITHAVVHPNIMSQTLASRKRTRSGTFVPVVDIPMAEPLVEAVNTFRSVESQEGVCLDAPIGKEDAQLDEKLENDEEVMIERRDLDVGVNQSCKGATEVRGRARKKQYKISRNYYHSKKKKSTTKDGLQGKESSRSAVSSAIPWEAKIDTDTNKKDDRSLKSLGTRMPTCSSSLEEHGGSAENGHLKDTSKKDDRSQKSLRRTMLKCSSSLEDHEGSAENGHLKDTSKKDDRPLKSPGRSMHKRASALEDHEGSAENGHIKDSSKKDDRSLKSLERSTVKCSSALEDHERSAENGHLKDTSKKDDRSLKSLGRSILKCASSLEDHEGLAKNGHLKRGRQTKNSIVPPPLPSPRVADKSKVTEAFGLKRSLHGRLLVPPLATWRSQSIQYDMDGGIIAISDGFTGSEDETGCYNFKPPADKDARTLQRRLCKAAKKGSRRK